MNKLSKIFLFVIIGLLVILACTIIYYSMSNSSENKLTNEIGTPVKINTVANASVSTSILIEGDMLPEDEIEQNLTIFAPSNSDVVFRVSVFFADLTGKRTYLDILTMPNYLKIGNYYYYTNVLTKQTSTKFSNKIILPKMEDFMLFSNEIYSLNFLVEAYSDKETAINLWNVEY